METNSRLSYFTAIEDFRRARRQAALEDLLARLTGRSANLLSFEEVRQQLKARGAISRGLKEIPLDAIVGSVGRYTDFTRSFLPRRQSDQERWARVQVAITDLGTFPPIEVYQIGDVYFVLDGNHRVSIARKLGATHIQAYVSEVPTKVPLSADVRPDELILKAEYADFLERTNLDEIRPKADLQVTNPGRYPQLLQQIDAQRYSMQEAQGREIPYPEAVGAWYDEIYLPVVRLIRERGLLRDFPGRTETDLYVWIAKYREVLQEELGWEIGVQSVASELVGRRRSRPKRMVARLGRRLRGAFTPRELDEGPPPGEWRRERVASRREDRLFSEILVALSGEPVGWNALEQALVLARREDARLLGLHVVRSVLQIDSIPGQLMQREFERRCQEAGIRGQLVIRSGPVASVICRRASWVDLVVVNLAHPPAREPIVKLKSGFRTLVRSCPRPLLAVPGSSNNLESALLAYDGSPKAEEALFVAAYLAARWKIPLTVLTVSVPPRGSEEVLQRARGYLESLGIEASYRHRTGPVADAVVESVTDGAIDLIVMGGYGLSAIGEVVLGSTVDQLLRARVRPILICR